MPNQHSRLDSVWTDVQGRKVHARVSTTAQPNGKPPVILVHGLIVSSRYLAPLAEILARDFHVYAPDLPGFGRSDKPGGFDTVETLAEWLMKYMDAIGLERSAFLANSMGCQVLVEAAIRYPERVRNMVLNAPVIDRHARTIPRQVGRAMVDFPRERPALFPIQALDFVQAGPRRFVRSLGSMMSYPIEEKLPHIHDPVLVVRGQHDSIVPQHWAEECARLLPHGRLIVLPGSAHTSNFSTPLQLARVSRPFLARADVSHSTGETPHESTDLQTPGTSRAALHPELRLGVSDAAGTEQLPRTE